MLSVGEFGRETYSSYKNKMFNKYVQRVKTLFDGVDQSSLKGNDKKLVKKKMLEAVSPDLKEALALLKEYNKEASLCEGLAGHRKKTKTFLRKFGIN